MTLPDAVAYALDHSSTVASQKAALTNAQHQLALQRGVAYPLVNATLQSILAKSANYQGGFAVIGAQQQNVVSQNTAQIGISNWNLTSGGYSFLLVSAARAQEEQAAKTLANTEDQIATNVTNSYYAIVERRGLVAVDEFTLRYQNELVESGANQRARRRRRRGQRVAGKDVGAKSESTLIADRASVEDASQTLAQQIGAPILTAIRAFPFACAAAGNSARNGRHARRHRRRQPPGCRRGAASRRRRAAIRGAVGTSNSFHKSRSRPDIGNQFSPTSAVELQSEFDQECHPPASVPPPAGCPLIAPRGSFGYWSLQAISTFCLPLDRLQRAAQRARQRRCATRVGPNHARTDAVAKRTGRAPKLSRGADRARAVGVGQAGSRLRHRVGADRATTIQGRRKNDLRRATSATGGPTSGGRRHHSPRQLRRSGGQTARVARYLRRATRQWPTSNERENER